MDWSKATSTTTIDHVSGLSFTYDRMPARYTGQRNEFYSGVTPGVEGTAERVTPPTGSHFYSFSVGGPWLSVKEEELEEVEE